MDLSNFHRLMSPKLTLLVTTVDERGKPDVSPFSFVAPVAFDPPMLMISVGPNKHSYWNLTRTNEFIAHVPSEKMVEQIWVAGGKYDPEQSKIAKAGFKTKPATKVKAPVLTECPVAFECYVENARKVGDHVIVIGKVVEMHVDKKFLDEKGNLKVDVVRPPLHVAENLFAFPYVTKSV